MAELLAPILELVVGLVALAIAFMARNLAAPFINFFSRQIWSFLKPIDWLINRMIDLAIELTKNIAPAFENGVKPLVGYLHALGQLSEYTAHAIYRNALQLNQFAHWVTQTYIPRELRGIGGHTTEVTLTKVRTQALTKAQVDRIESQIEYTIYKSQAAAIPGIVAKPFPQINWSVKKWRQYLGLAAGAGALTLPGTLAGERGRWKEQDKTNSQTHKRFRTLNWLLAFTGAAGLVAAGLAKLGLGWMAKCPNLKHIGKSFCAADLAGLIGALGLLVAIEEGVGLEDFANAMLKIEVPVVNGVLAGISEFEGITA